MINHVEKLDPKLYRMLESLLKTGKVERDGYLANFSPVQNITIGNGLMRFDPPLEVSGKFGFLRVHTTISEIGCEANRDAITADLESSPINLEIRPNE